MLPLFLIFILYIIKIYSFPIGTIVESFRTDFDRAIEKAAQIGVEGLQLYTVKGEFSAENLSRERRKEILKKVWTVIDRDFRIAVDFCRNYDV